MAKVQLEAILKLVDVQINPQVFSKISQSVAGLPASIKQTSSSLTGASAATQTFNKSLQQTGQQLTANEKAARLLLQRTSQFAILLPIFVTLNKALQGGVKFLFEFDDALRDIVRTDVKGLSSRMEEIGDAALKTANKFGVTAQEVLGLTKTFVQAGLTIEDSQKRTELAITATQVSTLSAADATEFFLAVTQQFGVAADDLATTLDALVKVEDVAAVEARDIAEAFSTGGNAFAFFGKNVNDAIGIITALREQTRKSGSEIGTFFKSFAPRVFAAGPARDAVEALGVSVENLDGSLRPALSVINDLSVAFGRLTESQAADSAKVIAGIRQYETFEALLVSNARANDIVAKANTAAGTAAQKRLITDEKLDRQIGRLIAQGQTLAESLGDAGLEDTLRSALKVATGLLKVFTGMSDVVSSIGGNITPLLALAGFTLGKSIFGVAGKAAGGLGGGAGAGVAGAAQANAAGSSSQIAAQQLAPAITGIKAELGILGSAIKNTSLAFGTYVKNMFVVGEKQIVGLYDSIAAQEQFANAARRDAELLLATQKQNIAAKGGSLLSGGTGALLTSLLGATIIPQIFGPLEKSSKGLANTWLKATDSGLSMGATFLATGDLVAAGGALVVGFLGSLASSVFEAIKVNEEATKQQEELDKSESRISQGKVKLTGSSESEKGLQKNLLVSLQEGVFNKTGPAVAEGLKKAFDRFAGQSQTKKAGLGDAGEIQQSLFGDIAAFKTFVTNNKDVIDSMAESNGKLEESSALFQILAHASQKDLGPALSKLWSIMGAGGAAADSAGEAIARAQRSFEEISKVRTGEDLANSLRTLNMNIDLAKEGPTALSDSLQHMTKEFDIAQKNFNGEQFTQKLQDIKERLGSAAEFGGIGLDPAKASAQEFFDIVLKGSQALDPKAIQDYLKWYESLPAAQQGAADEVTKILTDKRNAEFDLAKQSLAIEKEKTDRAKKLLDEQQKAYLGAFESTRKFSAELQKFGDAVNKDVLANFQNVSLGDVKDVLAGKSGLAEGLQQIIKSSFGEDKGASHVSKAQTEFRATIDATQATLDILAKKIEMVNGKLADQANANDFASLTGEKLNLQTEVENAKQEGSIAATEAKIKVLEAERQAAKENLEQEKKRSDLLDKLTDASRNFSKELRSLNRSFDDFQKEKRAELLDKEKNAEKELQDTEKGVLDATKNLANAYKDLIHAQLDFNGVLVETKIKNSLLSRDIALLTGGISTFDEKLSALNHAFVDSLSQANIPLQKRIDLERQLAEETLSFLQKARDDIEQAGLGVFGQSATENQDLGKGIAGLQFVADTLGGSFDSFLNMTESQLTSVTQTLLSLPEGLRKQILDALSFLPSTTNIGGFDIDQLKQAIGQVGAGTDAAAGLPSLEELNSKQVEQLQKLQDLALQDAQLQFSQVLAAQKQVDAATEAADAAKILQERATKSLSDIREAVMQETGVLDLANQQRQELLKEVIAATDRNALMQIEKEATLFADQNKAFAAVGDNIVQGISSAIAARLSVIDAQSAISDNNAIQNSAAGYIPNFSGGNLKPHEAAGLLHAAMREKRAMPAGAGLAIANTSEAIIPMRNRGFIPNFADGNMDSISTGISAIKNINGSVVAAISQSIASTISNLNKDTGGNSNEMLTEVVGQLKAMNDTLNSVNLSNTNIQANTSANNGAAPAAQARESVRIVLETNQNNSIAINGLSTLRDEIAAAVKNAASDQVDTQLSSLLKEFDGVISALQERGILTSLGQIR